MDMLRPAANALALLMLVFAAGCQALGGPVAGGDHSAVIARSADKLQEGAPYHFKAITTLREQGAASPSLQIDTEGDVASLTRARLTLTSPQEPTFKLELVLYDEALYVRQAGDDWEQLLATQLGELGPSPLDTVAFLRAATGPVEDKGADAVDGLPTRRYAFALDAQRIADQMEKLGRPIALAAVKGGSAEVWLTPDAVTHRSKVSLDLASPRGGATGVLEVDTRSTRHGQSVTIERPQVAPSPPTGGS